MLSWGGYGNLGRSDKKLDCTLKKDWFLLVCYVAYSIRAAVLRDEAPSSIVWYWGDLCDLAPFSFKLSSSHTKML